VRVPGTAVFLTGNPDTGAAALLHNLKHIRVLHERVMLKVQTEEVPQVPDSERMQVEHLGGNVHHVLLRYGSWSIRT
jgi:KUP system potassium uptake protein